MKSNNFNENQNSDRIAVDNQKFRILTVEEVASLLRVHPSTISRFARSGELASYLVGSRRVFKESDVWSFFENRRDRECAFGKEQYHGNCGDPKA